MSTDKIRATLEKQLGLLSKCSELDNGENLPQLTSAMIDLSAMILAFE